MKKISILVASAFALLAFTASAAEGNAAFQQKLALAKTGDAKAQAYVGMRYDKGTDGVTANPDETIKWLTAAAWQDQMGAQAIVGMRYFSRKNYIESYKWLSLAAQKGHANSKKQLPNVEKKLKPNELAEAKKFVENFKPKVVIPE